MAVRYLGGNRITGLNEDSKPTLASTALGATFIETDTDDMFQWDGDSWELVASGSALRVKEITAPGNQDTNWGVVYVDTSDEKLYYKFESEAAIDLTVSSSAQNLFQTIAVGGQANVVADTTTDTLTLVGGTNVTITTNASNDTITFAASG